MNGDMIKNTEENKNLGVTLDILKFISSFNSFIRNSLSSEPAKSFLNTMILSHVLYRIFSWSQANKTALNPIKSLYITKLYKTWIKKPRLSYHCNLISKYKMLSFKNLVKFFDIRLGHKIIHNAAPRPPLKNFMQPCSEMLGRALRTVSRVDCSIPERSSASSQSAFSYKAIKERNKLPQSKKYYQLPQFFPRS